MSWLDSWPAGGPLLVAALCAIATAVAGAVLTRLGVWYDQLRKPSWQPPDWAFGPAWTVIFALAAFAGARAWTDAPPGDVRTAIVALFVLNMLLNAAWSLLFFTWRRPDWALIEVVALWLSVAALIVAVTPVTRAGGLALVPYLLWVTFAGYLNLTIVRLNGPFAAARAAGRAP